MSFGLLLNSCSEDDEALVFEHEKNQFELQSGALLVELITPRSTLSGEAIYIVGDFNGGESAVGDDQWKLSVSPNTSYRQGIYLDPSRFVDGKTLSDGYRFVASQSGEERLLDCSSVSRNQNVAPGDRLVCEVEKWASACEVPEPEPEPDGEWPAPEEGKIMLRLELPEYTPENARILLYGAVNGWDGSDETKWATTELEPGRHYMMLDPADFAEGTSLADQFKFGLIVEGFDWWYHQDNLDGGSEDGPGHAIADTSVGNFYEIEIVNWRSSSEL